MVTLDTQLSKIQKLLGKNITTKELEENLFNLGMELDDIDGDELKIDITAERPDMVSTYGLARALKSYMSIETGLKEYKITKSGEKVIVDKSTKNVRPYTVAAIVKGLEFDDKKIKELIWVQEKLHATFARGRKKAAIGIYPFEKIKLPIHYIAKDPKDIRFVPLESDKELNGYEILDKHPTGQKYAHLLREHKQYPIFIDSNNEILSMPPIINSQKRGRVTEDTKEIFIECSGSDLNALKVILNILVTIFSDMGGKIYSMDIEYADKTITTPDLTPETRKISVDYVNKLIGINIDAKKMKKYLEQMGYDVINIDKTILTILIPPYRTDILHDVDIADDVARAYGFENIEMVIPLVVTTGGTTEESKLKETVQEQMIGFGYQESLTLVITNKEEQYNKMNISEQPHVNLGESTEKSFNMIRSWLIPSVLKSLSNNKHKEYPQKLFDIDYVIKPDVKTDTRTKQRLHLAAVTAHSDSDYTEIKAVTERLLENIGIKYRFEECDKPYFMEGRGAKIIVDNKKIGIIGALHPKVISNWDIDVPVVVLELEFKSEK
ncbi:MAG: phenylalanine--tRNA ligase subunit beta [DPANN group archaeon]|nr:phenylalanine--tRNA ligase subunit beta [DPANN group archaeon]